MKYSLIEKDIFVGFKKIKMKKIKFLNFRFLSHKKQNKKTHKTKLIILICQIKKQLENFQTRK